MHSIGHRLADIGYANVAGALLILTLILTAFTYISMLLYSYPIAMAMTVTPILAFIGYKINGAYEIIKSSIPLGSAGLGIPFLFRNNDGCYSTKELVKFSLIKKGEYLSFNEIKERAFPAAEGYEFDEEGRIVPGKDMNCLNYKEISRILISNDPSELEKNSWMFKGASKFLDGEEFNNTVTMATYPRSGNTMVRRMIEEITGIATGNWFKPEGLLELEL